MKKVAIYGAGGFGREVKAMALHQRLHVLGFVDDDPQKNTITNLMEVDDIIVAIADPAIRFKIIQDWKLKKVSFESLVHHKVELNSTTSVGKGNVICAGVQITVDITLGDFVIINLNSTIGHDSIVGSFSSIMPSVNISGHVTIGARVFVGTGANILQGLTIGDGAIVGAGTLVTKDIPAGATVVGVPGRIIKSQHG